MAWRLHKNISLDVLETMSYSDVTKLINDAYDSMLILGQSVPKTPYGDIMIFGCDDPPYDYMTSPAYQEFVYLYKWVCRARMFQDEYMFDDRVDEQDDALVDDELTDD